jgi:hypothetical protein
MDAERFKYKTWLINELIDYPYVGVDEAHRLVTDFMKTPKFIESFGRWQALRHDVLLCATPAEQVNFPDV